VSESDSFIREVTEEVRQERMRRLWRRFGPYVIGGLVLIVAASAAWTWLQRQEAVEARATGGAFLSAERDDVAAAERLAQGTEGAAAPIARLRLAAAQAATGDAAGAAETYRAVAGTPGLPPAYADLAALKAVRLEARAGDPAAAAERLAPLAEEGAPYRPLALELRAALRLNAGDEAGARDDLEAIMDAPEATAALRGRAGLLLETLGGAGRGDG
jgi:hypothetical protein